MVNTLVCCTNRHSQSCVPKIFGAYALELTLSKKNGPLYVKFIYCSCCSAIVCLILFEIKQKLISNQVKVDAIANTDGSYLSFLPGVVRSQGNLLFVLI